MERTGSENPSPACPPWYPQRRWRWGADWAGTGSLGQSSYALSFVTQPQLITETQSGVALRMLSLGLDLPAPNPGPSSASSVKLGRFCDFSVPLSLNLKIIFKMGYCEGIEWPLNRFIFSSENMWVVNCLKSFWQTPKQKQYITFTMQKLPIPLILDASNVIPRMYTE